MIFNQTIKGGWAYATLIVQAPYGSTVTVSKDGVTESKAVSKTGSVWQASFVLKKQGNWTVTATDGTKTETETVLIDAWAVFTIEIPYRLWLYRDGDECVGVTGGWVKFSPGSAWYGYLYTGTVNKQATEIYITTDDTGRNLPGLHTLTTIDITNYTTLNVEFRDATKRLYGGVYRHCIISMATKVDDAHMESYYLDDCTIEMDGTGSLSKYISDISGNVYITIQSQAINDIHAYIKKVWLE